MKTKKLKTKTKTMNAKTVMREAWIMLKRPFKFAELKEPLQKMTILYAYSEQPIISYGYTKEGKELLDFAYENIDKPFTPITTPKERVWRTFFGKSPEDSYYQMRIETQLEQLKQKHRTVEVYEGQIVQCTIEGVICRFYPDEYTIIGQDTFDYVLTCDEYTMNIENDTLFTQPEIRDKLFYIQSRGISKKDAERMSAYNAKDGVIFRPRKELLEMFCREHEIY